MRSVRVFTWQMARVILIPAAMVLAWTPLFGRLLGAGIAAGACSVEGDERARAGLQLANRAPGLIGESHPGTDAPHGSSGPPVCRSRDGTGQVLAVKISQVRHNQRSEHEGD